MAGRGLTRRAALRNGAGILATTTGALGAPMVHAQGTPGRFSVGLWDHRVPPANATIRQVVTAWAQAHRLDLRLEFIATANNRLPLTVAADMQARLGHDLMTFDPWRVAEAQRFLEPMDDVMGRLVQANGPVAAEAERLARPDGTTWRAVPATFGSHMTGVAARLDALRQHAGLDLQAMYPAEPRLGPTAEVWTWDTLLHAAEACARAGLPFALPAGTGADALGWIGACIASHGGALVDAAGNVTVRGNDGLRRAMDYLARLFQHVPAEMFAAQDETTARALVAGRTALVMAPPSAWVAARQDAPQVAGQVWHLPPPRGPAGQFVAEYGFCWGVWRFSRARQPAKDLIEHLSQPAQVAAMVAASEGFDIPPFPRLRDQPAWAAAGPPAGTLFNYPPRPHLGARSAPPMAPPEMALRLAAQAIPARMVQRLVQGREPIDRVLAWAEREIAGMRRS